MKDNKVESVYIALDKTKIKITPNGMRVININKKGTIKRRQECAACKRRSYYQAGILCVLSCCEREDGWRSFEGETTRKCKYFLPRE